MTAIDTRAIPSHLPEPTRFKQYLALTERDVRSILKNDLVGTLTAPLVFTLGFYLPLHWIMSRTMPDLNYAQFIMPIIVLQSAAFTMGTVAIQTAIEAITGFSDRLHTMPVGRVTPLAAAMTSGMFRTTISVAAALTYGHLIGFRFESVSSAAGFIAFALLTAFVLALFGDFLGNVIANPVTVTQMITLPALIFGMLSSGFMPDGGFPRWIRPFVRNQPISQLSIALRDLSNGTATFHVLVPGMLWLGALAAIFLPLAVRARNKQ
ncbi:MAG: ABC transporter permease [Nocardiaceae bacterium]|nr:ABC transporter permease [Nocardiaceae bacterium]